jgi:uncharacterized repeat protein (TIGR03803 family)
MNKISWMIRACGVCLLWATAAVALPAQTFSTLHSFNANGSDGYRPEAAMVQGTNGNLYGTTEGGGADGGYQGTIFKITTSGTLAIIYSFCSLSDCADGTNPIAGLVQGTDGNLYGTAYEGGGQAACTDQNGCGTVFKITPTGTLTVLYAFCSQSNCTDGRGPQGTLVQGTDGNFYGTTAFGGANSCNKGAGCGTVFKITPSGALTTLLSFNGVDGDFARAGLVQGADGNFYGTTQTGGAGLGTVYMVTPSGKLTTLYSFSGRDGSAPVAGLVQGADGNFYGTTFGGGANGVGTVFKITSGGTLTTLYSFCSQSNCTDGSSPDAALVQSADGNFYGTTNEGGPNSNGTVFRITSDGTLTTLHTFCLPSEFGCKDGSSPDAALAQDTNGEFYGTTSAGGTYGDGTVFSLSVGLGPFVETNPTSGKVGKAVKILGTNLTGATSVTFNGTAATFTVKSKSEITTTVPTGATSGTVQVVTPGGTLSSNVVFRVTP